MAQIVNMPKEGITVESCIVGAWRKDIGDAVAVDDVLFEYETDKAAFECLSTAEGVLLHKFYEPGDEAPVLRPAAIVGAAGEDVAALIAEGAEGDQSGALDISASRPDSSSTIRDKDDANLGSSFGSGPQDTERRSVSDGSESQGGVMAAGGGAVASPRARSFAAEQGIDVRTAVGTGPGGRILEADVIAAANYMAATGEAGRSGALDLGAARPEVSHTDTIGVVTPTDMAPDAAPADIASEAGADPTDAEYTDEPFTNIRGVIAKAMVASLANSAQLTHQHSFDATSILSMREDFKAADEALGYGGVSVGDIILFVTSRVLAKHPEINAHVMGESLRKYHTVNLGLAVDTPRGLMVPTIFGAEKKSLKTISSEVKVLAAAAREGRISPDRLAGGTFTVSNLGATGVEVFTPIINPPQAAILGVCGVTERVRKGKDGQPEVYSSMGLSLTYDHRAIDGAPASRFAAELCEALGGFSWRALALDRKGGAI
ncbi:MAG: 2-oxo acid dehydrogenase subunit E2 [Clostridiales bacterium]|nr:2-oxo acid dehydrogenase subunit E2 [Clostridiales bacterium]